LHSLGPLAWSGGDHRRDDFAPGPQREESLAAKIAPVSRKTEQPLKETQWVLIDPVARNGIEIEIPAARTVGIMAERVRHAASAKAVIAGVAAPRL
jgi:hypothetical protein